MFVSHSSETERATTALLCPLNSSHLTVIYCPFPLRHFVGVSLCKPIHSSIHSSVQLVAVSTLGLVFSQSQSWLAGVPVPQNLIHVILRSDPQELLFVTLLFLLVFVAVVLAGVMVVEASHLPADVLEILVDANLGEALSVLLTGFIKHLSLNVDVVRPVLGLEEGGLGEAGSNGPDQEGCDGHHQQKHPATSL